MSSIVTNNTSALGHYLSYQNNTIGDFPILASLALTGPATLTTSNAAAGSVANSLLVATSKTFAKLTTITDLPTDAFVVVKDTGLAAWGVQFVPVTNGGSGYTTPPVVTIGGTGGTGATGVGVLNANGQVVAVQITNPGTLYTAGAACTCAAPGGGGTTATLGSSVLGNGCAWLKAHAGIDAIFPFMAGCYSGTFLIPSTATSTFTYTVVNGASGVGLDIMVINDTGWSDLGQNWNESLSFTKGVMTTPVARGWNATDHSARVRSMNHMSIKQLYSSMLEGVANLRGKTIMIMDQVRPDGGSIVKETHYIVSATVENAALSIGGGGGAAMLDAVDLSGYFAHMYTWTQDATVQVTTF